MQPRRINLNLFVALQAILNSDTLTEAAKSVHVTQSAMSTSLRKLREHFDNPIISYTRGRTELTPLGHALRPRVAEMLQLSLDMLKLREDFDPLTSRATFRLSTIDSVEIIVIPELLRIVTEAAPHVRITSSPVNYLNSTGALETDVDVAFVREGFHNPNLETEVLYADRFVVIVWSGHPGVGDTLTLEQYRSMPQASIQNVVTDAHQIRNRPYALAFDGIEVAVTTRSFAGLVHVVVGTKLIGVIPRRLALVFAQSMPIRILEVPTELPHVRLLAQWHGYKTSDPAMTWLLGMIRQATKHLRDDS